MCVWWYVLYCNTCYGDGHDAYVVMDGGVICGNTNVYVMHKYVLWCMDCVVTYCIVCACHMVCMCGTVHYNIVICVHIW